MVFEYAAAARAPTVSGVILGVTRPAAPRCVGRGVDTHRTALSNASATRACLPTRPKCRQPNQPLSHVRTRNKGGGLVRSRLSLCSPP